MENWYKFSLKWMVEFTKKPIWDLCYLFWKIITYYINLFKIYWLIHITYSCVSFGKLCLSNNQSISFMLTYLWTSSCSFLYYPFNSHVTCRDVPFIPDVSNLCIHSFFLSSLVDIYWLYRSFQISTLSVQKSLWFNLCCFSYLE